MATSATAAKGVPAATANVRRRVPCAATVYSATRSGGRKNGEGSFNCK